MTTLPRISGREAVATLRTGRFSIRSSARRTLYRRPLGSKRRTSSVIRAKW